eukprot:TRINITY_DN232_c0_g1_i2.p1 TRINITY_DN232_c0_g1~~TRINITY_DN232_c0_g1_i2.p1  ORF type:complete len:1564 (+),score=452.99 TRINITY_DN232_c0_g1_i2:439-5130(+)
MESGGSGIECVEILSDDGRDPPRQLVFRGSHSEFDLAVKVLLVPERVREAVEDILNDMKTNVVVQTLRVKGYHWILMQYCDCSIGDAIALLRELSEEEIQAVVWSVLQCLDSWHSSDTAHANIKPNNILLADGKVTLSDENMSALSAHPHPARLCPEGEELNDLPPADIWALGLCIIEMVDKVSPYYQLTEEEVEARQQEGIPEIQSRAPRSKLMNDFIKHCLEPNPDRRATIDSLMSHPWMQVSESEAEDLIKGIADRVAFVMEEWDAANGGHVPRQRVIRAFQAQLADSKVPLDEIKPGPLVKLPNELTDLPECMRPEEEPEPVVLRDKTGGEFWLSKPDPSAEPQVTIISNVSKVQVFLLGPNLKVLVRRMKNGFLMIGPCAGSVRLEGLENVQVSVAARSVELEKCQHVHLTLYTKEPLQLEGCLLETIEIQPWNWKYPRQAELMKLAGLDPYENRWNEVESDDGNGHVLRLLHDPYVMFSEQEFKIAEMEDSASSEQAVFKLRDLTAPVRPDDSNCIYVTSRSQVRVVKRPGELKGKSLLLENNTRCEFLFLDCLEEVELTNLTACQVVLGPTKRLIMRGLVSCVVVVACREAKIFGCSDACMFMWCAEPPIVVGSVLEIADFNVCWPHLDEQVKSMGWSGKGKLHEIKDGDPEISSEVAKRDTVPYREIPVLDRDGDVVAPMVFPFDDSELVRDAGQCDFRPVTCSEPYKRHFPSSIADDPNTVRSLVNKSVTPFPPEFVGTAGTAIRNVSGVHVVRRDGSVNGNLVLENIAESEVLVLDKSDAASVRMATDSKIVIGPVKKVLVLEDCTNCVVAAAASEIIIKHCKDIKLFAWCSNNFVVHGSAVELYPFNVVYPELHEQAVHAFGEARLRHPSRHTKVLDMSKNDERYPEPHYTVYPPEYVAKEVIGIGDGALAFPFRPEPALALDDASEYSSEPTSPTSPQDVVVKSPNLVSHVRGERIEREMGSLHNSGFELDNATQCTVIIADVASFVKVRNCSSCEIVIGPVMGKVSLSSLVDCKVWCVASSIEASGLKGCQLFLFCATQPVISATTGTTLSPFNAKLPNLPQLFSKAGIDPAVNRFGTPELISSDVAQPEFVGVLPMQSFKLLSQLLQDPVGVPEIEDFIAGKVKKPESVHADPTADPSVPLWRTAVQAALSGEDMKGPWDVAGENLPPPHKWYKSEVTPTSATFFKGRTTVIPDSETKRGQQVELTGLIDCRIVVLGPCNNYIVEKCENCEFVLGPCSAALFIRNSKNLCITGACRQLRLCEVTDAELFLHVETDPCVESSTGIVLRPLNMKIPGQCAAFEETKLKAHENRFHHAADFNTFSNANAVIGFKIPEWVGVLKVRSIAYFGHGVADVPEGTIAILEGASKGGASLEKSSGVYAMGEKGVTAKAAFKQHLGVEDEEDDDIDDESDLTLESDMRSGRSTKKDEKVEEDEPTAVGLAVSPIAEVAEKERTSVESLQAKVSAPKPGVHYDASSKVAQKETAADIVRRLTLPDVAVPSSLDEEVAGRVRESLSSTSVRLENLRNEWKEIEELEKTVDTLLEEIGANN